jgi:DnaK suppressor protein
MAALTDAQLRDFRQQLQDRREALREEIHQELMQEEEESYAELAGRVRDSGDESIADVLSDWNLTVIGRQLEEMGRIEPALRRIDAGTYGICVDCEAQIETARLQASPTAERCTRCQTHHEKTYAGKGTPSI